ncbi:hypothetical protein LPJ53_004446 [Coemansia erecta]|uniref:Uncharacterized protein n=1 Tax=Coemansia erecta TaxID=147472 RepID=A0A9W8CRC4_9FUNG|nr:hypothetical protein LPJ53_004446 [Coemansia erecta]
MTAAENQAMPKKKKAASIMSFFGRSTPKKDTEATLPLNPASPQIQDTSDCMIVESTPTKSKSKPQAEAAPDTPSRSTLVTYRNGKIVYSEKKLGLERHPSVIAAVFGFHQLIAKMKQESAESLPLTSIPTEHRPLVAMMVQERDVTIGSLVKSIESQLCPVVFGQDSSSKSDILAPGVVEATILEIADHKNYGVLLSDIQKSCQMPLEDVPNNLSIQRWEVRDISLLPGDVREIVLKRRKAREEAHEECVQWFRSLDIEIQGQILSGTLKKLKLSALSTPASSAPAATASATGAGNHSQTGKSADVSSEKPGKDRQHLLPGQRSLQNFFTRDKGPDKSKRDSDTQHSSRNQSYYESAFMAFHLRRNTTIYKYERPSSFDPTRIDATLGSPSLQLEDSMQSGGSTDVRSLLNEFVNSGAIEANCPSFSAPATGTHDMDEAEMLQWRLEQLPIKLIHFHGSQRPAYWGTWSRQLRNVSGRRPFAQDTTVIDYDVDSEAEWGADEGEGEELNSDDDDDDDDDADEDEDDDEDDEDFDEERAFIVGDLATGPDNVSDQDGDSDSDTESTFVSEDEAIEDIDPSEEVCANDMEVDESNASDDGVEVVSSIRPMRSRRKVPLEQQQRNLAEIRKEDRLLQRQRRRQRVQPLVPATIGLIWDEGDVVGSDEQDNSNLLASLVVKPLRATLPLSISTDPEAIQPSQQKDAVLKPDAASSSLNRKNRDITDQDLFILVNIVHGSSLGVLRLVEELKPKLPDVSKAHIERLIHEHATKEKRAPSTRPLWYVNAELVQRAKNARAVEGGLFASVEQTVLQFKNDTQDLSGNAGYSTGAISDERNPAKRKQRRHKNPLLPSKEQVDGSGEVVFPGPFSSAYSTVDTIPLDQATADYRLALSRIRESKKDSIVIGKKATDVPQNNTGPDDIDIVPASPESSSYYSED